MPLGKGLLSKVGLKPPLSPRLVSGQDSRQLVTDLPPKEDHGRAEASEGVRGVPVEQQRSSKSIRVQLAPGAMERVCDKEYL